MNRFVAFTTAVLLLVVGGRQQECSAFRSATSARMLSSRGKFGVHYNPQSSSSASPITPPTTSDSSSGSRTAAYAARKTLVLEREAETTVEDAHSYYYDPLNLASSSFDGRLPCRPTLLKPEDNNNNGGSLMTASSAALAAMLLGTQNANAAEALGSVISKDIMNPASFQPVCPASDNFYRFLQGGVEAIVGRDKFIEYGPLIAGGLLRVRLELCVVESFFNEAVGPFIAENGVSWILPLHETVETFLAGSIFALATTFILVGSTKLLTVITTYFDLLVGLPSRTFGGFFYDRALGRPVTLDIGVGPFKTRLLGPTDEVLATSKKEELVDLGNPITLLTVVTSGTVLFIGKVGQFAREFLEAIDLFVGRYLVFFATFYILVKFVHFKVFPDFP